LSEPRRQDERLPAGALSGPALALLELESIARGFTTADVLLKRADVTLAFAEPTTPGKFILLFHGPVADVDESYRAGLEHAGPLLLDKLFLPGPADALLRALEGKLGPKQSESLGIVETHTVASALLAADAALKEAEVWLTALHLAKGIGGKGYFTLAGDLHMVEAALLAAGAAIAPPLLLTTECIARPHAALRSRA
jgi:microcompartment protein CcmL/EutN